MFFFIKRPLDAWPQSELDDVAFFFSFFLPFFRFVVVILSMCKGRNIRGLRLTSLYLVQSKTLYPGTGYITMD